MADNVVSSSLLTFFWSRIAVEVPKISDIDKATVRENLMEAIVQAPYIIR